MRMYGAKGGRSDTASLVRPVRSELERKELLGD